MKKVDIPSMGESVTEATLLKWLKADGEAVGVDDPLCELETDKANVELPSPAAGILKRLKKEGETVRVGETVAQIEEGASATKTPPAPAKKASPAPSTPSPSPASRPSEPRPAKESALDSFSPSVRRIVEENKLDPASLSGSGPGGRVLKEDVLAKSTRASSPASSMAMESKVSGARPPVPMVPETGATGALFAFDSEGVQRTPMTKIRKKIAERLVAAQHQAAMLTTFNEIDMTNVLELRARYKEKFQETHGVSLGLMSFFSKAVILALKAFPIVNASIDENDIVFHEHVNLGIAVSTERGLIVPVLRSAEKLTLARIESEIKRMATAAREGKLGLNELSGGTFTITNGGVFGSLLSTPILNSPQSGILGMHSIQKRPVAVGDKVEVHPMMYVALSYDHRLVDGKDSVSFLVRVKEYIEDPARLMLEV